MKLSLCICVCVILVGLVKSSPMVTRSNYRGKRGNHQPFVPPPCNNETTLICRHLPNGDFDACMNPRAAQEQIRLGHATLGECNKTSVYVGDLITICHKPEGPSPQTIVVSAQSLQNHLNHGDTEGVCPDCFCDVAELEDTCIENPQAGEHLIFNGTCYKNANECPTSCDDSCPSACDDTCPTSCDDACPSACGDQDACPSGCGDQSVCPAACAELLDNCTCDDGQDGADGQDGTNGINGTNGVDGVDGDDGATGNCTNCPSAGQQNVKMCCYVAVLGPLPGNPNPPSFPILGQVIWIAQPLTCSNAPTNFVQCGGGLLSIANNQALFSMMQTFYGPGIPGTHFNVPNTQGMKGIVEVL